ncbi:hypothetical protein [Clostridium sp.]|uniref:hypothetical protein n=1 Tax=Clostridium sp. TaxID=1506 RepID=UPI0026195885|nr:hypothetical protein [Clostridium sp.]
MESPLTCTAYNGRGEYYFNKSPNIKDEALNEYLAENKRRMHSVLFSLKNNELIDDSILSYLVNRFRLLKTNLIKSHYVEMLIKVFRLLLNEEEKPDSQLHPIEEMYSLMNKYSDGDFKQGNLEEEIDGEGIPNSIDSDVEVKQPDERNGIAFENESTSLSIEDYSLVEKLVEQTSTEDKEALREKVLEMLKNFKSQYALTTDSKGQSRAEQHILRMWLYGKEKTSWLVNTKSDNFYKVPSRYSIGVR